LSKVKGYSTCGVPCIDGAYIDFFQEAAASMNSGLVDVMPIPGSSKDLFMPKMAAHRFVQSFISVSVAKHGINHILLCSHLCCGAYEHLGLSLPDEEALQREHIERAKHFLKDQVPLAIGHYLAYSDVDDHGKDNLKTVLSKGLIVDAFIIKPHNMSKRIVKPASECFVEKV